MCSVMKDGRQYLSVLWFTASGTVAVVDILHFNDKFYDFIG